VVFPEEGFPLDPNILMVTILKLSSDVDASNVGDGFSISLSSADCLKNMANEISRLYLPASEENPGVCALLRALKGNDGLVNIVVI
jgi:hypothetical protein